MYAIQFRNVSDRDAVVRERGITVQREYDDQADDSTWIEAALTSEQNEALRTDKRVLYFSEL